MIGANGVSGGRVPVPVESLLALAIQHVNAGRRDPARRLCERALAAHGPHPAVRQLLAVLSLQDGDPAQATAHAAASLAMRPDHPQTVAVAVDAGFRLALHRHDEGDLEAAAAALGEVLRLAPTHAEAHVNLGIVLQDAGRIDDAMRSYGRAYGLRPEAFGRIAHALAAANTGRLWLELDDLRTALSQAGDSAQAA